MIVRILLSILIAAALSACGGGDSPKSTDNQPGTNNNSSTPTNSNRSSNPPETTGLKLITGIYNTSRANDEAYLHIDESGLVTAFDYLGDASGNGENCYEISTDPSQTNAVLSGGSVRFSESDQNYTLTNGATQLVFSYTAGMGMSDFVFNNIISAGAGLDLAASNLNVKVGGNGALQTDTIQLTDILSSICN